MIFIIESNLRCLRHVLGPKRKLWKVLKRISGVLMFIAFKRISMKLFMQSHAFLEQFI